ncbi:uncharacterized protein LOC116609536 isoform X2 [Nematostella vectensis]|uniref:uncharacterized protein LOC116609536 isoform X2 n=1 Tax=Nematostella vectensis TaxID=45351 RepID=UPI002076EF0C|nr:uncharacterized protein LOC116609536 isoform X2 [Nematostella vectensis]
MASEIKFWNETAPSQGSVPGDFNIDDFILDTTSSANMFPSYSSGGSTQPSQTNTGQSHSAPVTSAPVFSFHSNPMASSEPSVIVQALDLKESYLKGQSRRKANSQQRLLDGEVHFIAKFSHPLQALHVYVERIPEAARILQDTTGRVPLAVILGETQGLKASFSVDLDSVYETSRGTKVYELSRVKGDERNVFRLVLSFVLLNGVAKDYVTKAFRVKSKTQHPKSTDSAEDIVNSCSSDDSYSYQSSPENTRKRKREKLGAYSPSSSSSGLGSDGASIPEIITDHLVAQTAIIEELRVNSPILSQRGDIAYHFPLKKSLKTESEALEEGDVIGFFEDPDGATYIQRLTHFNAKKAKSAGVISRSAYLEAKAPTDSDQKDLDEVVCVIGMVGVKVMGPVVNGERIYASMETPGVAVPQSRICDVSTHDAFLLGQSLETYECKPNDVTAVQCFVSILLSISSGHVTQAISDLRHNVKEDVKTEVRHVKKRCMMGTPCDRSVCTMSPQVRVAGSLGLWSWPSSSPSCCTSSSPQAPPFAITAAARGRLRARSCTSLSRQTINSFPESMAADSRSLISRKSWISISEKSTLKVRSTT